MRVRVELSRKIFRLIYEMLFSILLIQFVHVVVLRYEMNQVAVLGLIAMWIISYVVRNTITNYGINIVIHIAQTVIIWLMPISIGSKFILTIVAFNLLFNAIGYIIKGCKLKPIDDFPWPTFVFSFIVYIYGKGLDNGTLVTLSYIIPVILLMLYYVMVYLDGVIEYLESTKDVSGLPLKRIIGTNTALVGIILFITVLAICIGRFIDFRAIINAVYNSIIYIIKLVAVGLKFIFKFIILVLSGNGEGAIESAQNVVLPDAGEYTGTGNITDQLVLKIFFFGVLLYISYKLILNLIKRLSASRVYQGDIVEKVETNKRNNNIKIIPKRKKLFPMSNEEKVRKAYRYRILREKYDVKLSGDKTCRDIEKELSDNDLGDVSEITNIYSSVRYGKVSPDRKMVKRINRLSKQ